MTKKLVMRCVVGSLVFLVPAMAVAGGALREKIQQKMKSPSNIQFQQKDAAADYEYEPYYSEPQSAGKPMDEKGIKYNQEEVGGNEGYINRGGSGEMSAAPALQGAYVDRVAKTERTESLPILSAYAIYRTDYKAEIEDDVVTVKGEVLFEVFRKGWTRIPLIRTNVGLIDAVVNRGASFVTMQDGKYNLMIDKPGRYTLNIEFLIKASRERENGPGNFSFEVIPAPISQFEFTMPEQDVEIFVEPSIKTELRIEAKKTIAWAVMPNTNAISVRWTKALPKETITPVKLEPKIYGDTTTYAAIGEGVIRCQTTLTYSILQSEVPTFRIALPEDVSVLGVSGSDLRDWKVSQEKGLQYVDVYLNFGVKGTYALSLSYERKIAEGSAVVEIPVVRAMGVEREKGSFGIAAATNVELAVNKADHATLIDVKELPSTIWSSTTNPILLAFKYLSHPVTIAIEVTKHEELPVLVAAIDSAEYVTLQTEEGKNLSKAVYQVRNNVKQFLHLELPKDSTLWSVFVAGKPVKPAKDKNSSILIPLEKSRLSGENLAQFPVEIVYLDKTSKMGFVGRLRLSLPQTDIPVSVVQWQVYLPVEYAYVHFGGDVKQSYRALPGGLARGSVVMMEKKAADYLGSQSVSQFAMSPQQEFDMQGVRARGVLPIKIDIPQEGRLYQFSKLLVTENESPWLSAWFVYGTKQAYGFFKLVLFLAVLFLIYRFIRRFRK